MLLNISCIWSNSGWFKRRYGRKWVQYRRVEYSFYVCQAIHEKIWLLHWNICALRIRFQSRTSVPWIQSHGRSSLSCSNAVNNRLIFIDPWFRRKTLVKRSFLSWVNDLSDLHHLNFTVSSKYGSVDRQVEICEKYVIDFVA